MKTAILLTAIAIILTAIIDWMESVKDKTRVTDYLITICSVARFICGIVAAWFIYRE